MREEIGTNLTVFYEPGRVLAPVTARAHLGHDAYEAAWKAGHGLPPAQAVAEALATDPTPEAVSTAPEEFGGVQLTPREREVLTLLTEGRSNREIAAALFVSPRTVDNHVSNLLAKLDVRSSRAAVAVARRLGLV
jgi:DNA-binding NarL/FixJ family response regulator